jgi:type IV pilus assembly protein PilA
MHRLRLQSESGFTLIELLVVVAIIGILAAIAIPQFSAYRKRSYEAQVKSDLRNAAVAEEAYFTQKFVYQGGALNTGTPLGYNKSQNVTMTAQVFSDTFILTGSHALCTGVNWTYTSVGGVVSNTTCP